MSTLTNSRHELFAQRPNGQKDLAQEFAVRRRLTCARAGLLPGKPEARQETPFLFRETSSLMRPKPNTEPRLSHL